MKRNQELPEPGSSAFDPGAQQDPGTIETSELSLDVSERKPTIHVGQYRLMKSGSKLGKGCLGKPALAPSSESKEPY